MDLLLNPERSAMPVGCLRSRSNLTGRSGADSQIKQFLILVDLKFVTFLYKKVTNFKSTKIRNCFIWLSAPDLPVKLLLDRRHPTGIAERSGFKSKSIFYAAFKEE